MKKYIATFAALLVSAVCANAQISGSLQFLSAKTKKPVTSARVGKDVLLRVSVKDLHLIANQDVQFSYALSVVPKGASTPTRISGQLSGKFVLPASEGGLKETRKALADMKGTQSSTELITIPDFMPAGVATVTITLKTKGAGSISFNRSLDIKL